METTAIQQTKKPSIDDARNFLYEVQRKKNEKDGLLLKNLDYSDRKNVINLKILNLFDVSGSISPAQVMQFMRQLDKIKGLSTCMVMEVDDTIIAMYNYFKTNQNRVVRIQGGGGTEFRTAFQKAKIIKPDAMLLMTDGQIADLKSCKDPGCPVGWIMTPGSSFTPPFGEVLFSLPHKERSGI